MQQAAFYTLLTGLGTPALIWELIDFFNDPGALPYATEARKIRRLFLGRRLARLCLLCTGHSMQKVKTLRQEITAAYGPSLQVEIIPLACDDIGCATDDREMRKTVFETIARHAGPNLIIASGGRKTITQRIVEAAIMHGCAGYLAITVPQHLERTITTRQDARAHANKQSIIWMPADQFYTEKRQRIIREEMGDTFRSIYLLPNALIDRLQQDHIGCDPDKCTTELAWLNRLPKTDLHCHLGGAYDMDLLKDLARILLDDLGVDTARQRDIASVLEDRLGGKLTTLEPEALRHLDKNAVHCLANLEKLYEGLAEPHLHHAVLVASLSTAQLQRLADDGLDAPGGQLDWYMKSGDLAGSRLLQTENTLRRAVSWLVEQAQAQSIRYLELRFSPGNYTRAGLTIDQVVTIVRNEVEKRTRAVDITMNLLIMATRHKDEKEMRRHVDAAVRAAKQGGACRVAGFDLAGQEEENPPEEFAAIFEPLHEHFINVTIHAGEMDQDDKIWQALYRLHAKRIGHGLKLINNKKMMDHVRDWRIAVEMCPSSNRQTNGFRFYDQEETGPQYPLKHYLDHGIAVTVNTDNPGISKTTASRELLTAARLTRGGLSRWDILRLIRNGFKAAFLPKDEKDRLLKEADAQIFNLLLEEL